MSSLPIIDESIFLANPPTAPNLDAAKVAIPSTAEVTSLVNISRPAPAPKGLLGPIILTISWIEVINSVASVEPLTCCLASATILLVTPFVLSASYILLGLG